MKKRLFLIFGVVLGFWMQFFCLFANGPMNLSVSESLLKHLHTSEKNIYLTFPAHLEVFSIVNAIGIIDKNDLNRYRTFVPQCLFPKDSISIKRSVVINGEIDEKELNLFPKNQWRLGYNKKARTPTIDFSISYKADFIWDKNFEKIKDRNFFNFGRDKIKTKFIGFSGTALCAGDEDFFYLCLPVLLSPIKGGKPEPFFFEVFGGKGLKSQSFKSFEALRKLAQESELKIQMPVISKKASFNFVEAFIKKNVFPSYPGNTIWRIMYWKEDSSLNIDENGVFISSRTSAKLMGIGMGIEKKSESREKVFLIDRPFVFFIKNRNGEYFSLGSIVSL